MKRQFGDKVLDVQEIDFEIKREEWNEYTLLDGGRVRVKTIVTNIYRLLDDHGKPKTNPDGSPAFMVLHNTKVVT